MSQGFTPRLTPFTPREITPQGWLRRQLEIQANGLSGNLDRVWPDVRDSRWLGGDRDGWERVPYWLDGFIPLAFLLRDEDMMARAKKYVYAIMDKQEEDGWICPCKMEERHRYDPWAAILIAKVMVVYHDCTGDERVIEVVRGILSNLHRHIRGTSLFNWGAARSFELMTAVNRLYELTPEDWLLDLAVAIRTQGLDYAFLFKHWRDEEPRPIWSYQTHIVNMGMMLKSEAVYWRITGNDGNSQTKRIQSLLDRYHGGAAGYIAGDECLAGREPTHGVELCAIVEAMYSYEVLYAITGDPYWLTRLERLAYNALPAQNSEDMWTHQYLQLSNQTTCEPMSIYYTNGPESNLFGLEPTFGCCTANFNQGYPKLAASAFLREGEDTLVAALTLPAVLDTMVNGIGVRVACETDYPFKGHLAYTVRTDSPVAFALKLHVPENCSAVTVDGQAAVAENGFVTVRRTFAGESTLAIDLTFETVFRKTTGGLSCLWRGPLLYSLPIEGEWTRLEYTRDNVERKFPYCDYTVKPRGKWNYAFENAPITADEHAIGAIPFSESEPPVTLTATLSEIDWQARADYPNLCTAYPASKRRRGEPASHRLIPYGCTTLRMTEMPVLRKQK